MSSPALSATATKNVETIAKVGQQLAGQRTRMDRIGDAIARFFGTLLFIIAHAVFIAVWFVLNLGLFSGVQPFDPYPFPFLGLIVGIEFIFLTTFVLMNQNLQSRREAQCPEEAGNGVPDAVHSGSLTSQLLFDLGNGFDILLRRSR